MTKQLCAVSFFQTMPGLHFSGGACRAYQMFIHWIQPAVLHIFDGSTQAMSVQTWLIFSPGEPIKKALTPYSASLSQEEMSFL